MGDGIDCLKKWRKDGYLLGEVRIGEGRGDRLMGRVCVTPAPNADISPFPNVIYSCITVRGRQVQMHQRAIWRGHEGHVQAGEKKETGEANRYGGVDL